MSKTAQLREAVLSRMILNAPGQSENPKAFAMDWNTGAGQVATLVSFDDGTTSIYFSSGAGVIGAGEVPTVRSVAARYRAAFAGLDSHFRSVETWPLPAQAGFVFYEIDTTATRATRLFSSTEVLDTAHPLHALSMEAQGLITAIRTAEPVEQGQR